MTDERSSTFLWQKRHFISFLNRLPTPAQATFQRLGMQTSQQGLPSLEVSHLETKPLSPVDIEENTEDDIQEKEMKNNDTQGEKKIPAFEESSQPGKF